MERNELELLRKDENYRDLPANFSVKAKQGETYTITASTPEIDRDDEIILPSAYKSSLEPYLTKNPVILWMHNMYDPPIARAVAGRVGDTFELDIEFAPTPFAQEIKALVDGGFLNTVSVGGMYKDWTVDKEGRKVVTDLELWETSIVTVPSNRSAIITRAKQAGLLIPNYEQKTMEGSRQESKPEPITAGRQKTPGEKIRMYSALS